MFSSKSFIILAPICRSLIHFESIFYVMWSNGSISFFCMWLSSYPGASLAAQIVKHLPTMRETRVWSLGWEDPLEKEMATHSSILTWKMPWTEEPGRLQSMGSQRVGHDWVTSYSPDPVVQHPLFEETVLSHSVVLALWMKISWP